MGGLMRFSTTTEPLSPYQYEVTPYCELKFSTASTKHFFVVAAGVANFEKIDPVVPWRNHIYPIPIPEDLPELQLTKANDLELRLAAELQPAIFWPRSVQHPKSAEKPSENKW